jgi:serine/threonine-protein phosphatase CPPED1
MRRKNSLKKSLIGTGIASLSVLLLAGLFGSVHSATPLPQDRNAAEVRRIHLSSPSDYTFAVLGDNKGNTTIFEPLLRAIDKDPEIAFAVHTGDLVDGGTRDHYTAFLTQLNANMRRPFLAAIGNHDLDKGSASAYSEFFGPLHYSFKAGGDSFFVLNAYDESGLRRGELQWLEQELAKAQSSRNRFAFMHVPPFDPRGSGFDKCLKDGDRLVTLLKRHRLTHLFASHLHGYFSGSSEGLPYTITGGAGAKLQGKDPEHFFHHFVKVRVRGSGVDSAPIRATGK